MTPAPLIRVTETRLDLVPCRTRIPFRFGIHTLTEAPLATATVMVENEQGRTACGASSDLLVPKWFEKSAEKTPEEDSAELAESARAAFALAEASAPATVFGLWWELHRARVESEPRDAPDLLVRGFGISLLERAVMDAVCRLEGVSFHEALISDLFGFRPGEVHAELADWSPAGDLPAKAARAITLRHTIGMLDALQSSEVESEAEDDGFPRSLEEDIRSNGLTHFKIKMNGERDSDLERLGRIAAIFASEVEGTARFTLDGNEQFTNLAPLASLLEAVADTPGGREFLSGLMFIEQPLKREHTFDAEAHASLARVDAFAPLLIDEADCDTWAFPEAIGVGYRGVSVKACKGVFRALLNRGLCTVRNAADDRGLFQSGEDLTNLPVRALQQDLALMASLGMPHVERNGHHYFRGLDHLGEEVAASALAHHAGLYLREAGTVALRIEGGTLDLTSLQSPGFGCRLEPPLSPSGT